ncbi:hypothetical protein Y1Q_0014533 [Alligator mississippiensis]|uniref:Uncharacterized protein n=1 Tax=Alligator mississippiensis TaxID=8496 RepID=A0A151PDF8_ALLMI|nr:hypothetical protein Y1Q_0014533 [Alligator mississippiensis]
MWQQPQRVWLLHGAKTAANGATLCPGLDLACKEPCGLDPAWGRRAVNSAVASRWSQFGARNFSTAFSETDFQDLILGGAKIIRIYSGLSS